MQFSIFQSFFFTALIQFRVTSVISPHQVVMLSDATIQFSFLEKFSEMSFKSLTIKRHPKFKLKRCQRLTVYFNSLHQAQRFILLFPIICINLMELLFFLTDKTDVGYSCDVLQLNVKYFSSLGRFVVTMHNLI